MTTLTWDQVGSRVYENGIDHGVLYLSDSRVVPWNGLKTVTENSGGSTTPIYYDGIKIRDAVELGEFSATLTAITYPEEFLECEGVVELMPGAFAADQRPKPFGLSYRTYIGNDLVGMPLGYKMHILYNLTAVASSKDYETQTDDVSLIEFEWSLTAVPEELNGFRATAHIIIDSRTLDSWTLDYVESHLYGTDVLEPSLIPIAELVEILSLSVNIIDNGDGTWTARAYRSGFITDNGDGTFQIDNVEATYLDATTYIVSDTPS